MLSVPMSDENCFRGYYPIDIVMLVGVGEVFIQTQHAHYSNVNDVVPLLGKVLLINYTGKPEFSGLSI